MTTTGTSRTSSGRTGRDAAETWWEWAGGTGGWRPVGWLVLAAAAALPPGPSILLAGLLLVAGAAAYGAAHTEDVPRRVVLLSLTVAVGAVASYFTPHNGLGVVPLFVAAALVARLVPGRRTVTVFTVVVTVLCAVALFWVSRTGWASLGALGVPLIVLRTWDRAALHREHARVVALLDELEQRRDADVRAAAATERARIARDLHDVLAHTLSGLSLHMQAIRAVLAGRPDTPKEVIASVDRAADLARTGLDEARHAVAALRENAAQAPGSGELAALVAGHDGAGLDVDGDFDTLAPAEREAAFATVRESLTNAERHAPGADVRVRVATGDGLLVRVTDDGAAEPVTAGDHGNGAGLAGLAERAATVGGTLDAHADPPGWIVELRIPGPGRPESGQGAQ